MVAPAKKVRLWKGGVFLCSDGGFTSVGVVVALTVVVALILVACGVRWMASKSADVQNVADAGALAAANTIAEYRVIAQAADATVLSLGLFGATVEASALIVSCVPGLQGVGKGLSRVADQAFKARDNCAQNAGRGLDKLQKALPALCAWNGYKAIRGQRISADADISYTGIALPLPLQGGAVKVGELAVDSEREQLDAVKERTAQASAVAEQALRRMQEAKRVGYMADCGNALQGAAGPQAYCQYERAARKAQLYDVVRNPVYTESNWLFDYAYKRAQDYYAARLAMESYDGADMAAAADSAVRARFYDYAVQRLGQGHCRTAPDGLLDCDFPRMPKNLGEFKTTPLYTEMVYPSSVHPESGQRTIHGSVRCAMYQAETADILVSLAEQEDAGLRTCPHCQLDVSSAGNVASASTHIKNGFEYWYNRVAEAAEDYAQAARTYQDQNDKAREQASGAFDLLRRILKKVADKRISVDPPGAQGCLAVACDPRNRDLPKVLQNALISGQSRLGPRVAVSAARLASEPARRGQNLLASFMSGLQDQVKGSQLGGDLGLGALDGLLGLWSDCLMTYNQGLDALTDGLEAQLNKVPLLKATPLAAWARKGVQDLLDDCGLRPVDLSTPRAVLVNSWEVVTPESLLGRSKRAYTDQPGAGSGTLSAEAVGGLIGQLRSHVEAFIGGQLTLFRVKIAAFELPLQIKLPAALKRQVSALITQNLDALQTSLNPRSGEPLWQ